MQPSRFRLRDAMAVAAMLAVLVVAGRLSGSNLQSGEPAAPGRAPPSPTATRTPPPALPRTLPVVAQDPAAQPPRAPASQGSDDAGVIWVPCCWVAWAAGTSRLTLLTGPNAGGDGPRLRDPMGNWITGLAANADALWAATSDALYRIDPRRLG